MPITHLGPSCRRSGCGSPAGPEDLGADCRRPAQLVGKGARLFAYGPRHGYRDARDAVELPWEEWAREADARGGARANLSAAAGSGPESVGRATEGHEHLASRRV